MKLSILLFSLFLVSAYFSLGQVSNACSSAIQICDGAVVPINTGASPDPVVGDTNLISNPGSNPNPIPGNNGCLLTGEVNPNWFILTVESPGILAFYFSTGGTGFLDWSMWPYDAASCQMIENDSLAPVACNWNGTSSGLTGMADSLNIPATGTPSNFETPITVSAGDQFIICVNNVSSLVGTMNFTNTGSAGLCQTSASINEQDFSKEKELVKIVDVTGRVVKEQPNIVLIYLYSDGSSERVFKTE